MCTVVVRWAKDNPVLMLTLRDEWMERLYDDPSGWWPEHPGVIGGRDQRAGGTWCATQIASGASAVVLNRPQRPVGNRNAPSRGILPLVALQYGPAWPSVVAVRDMASFSLLLASPDSLTLWTFDGRELVQEALSEGIRMLTPRGSDDDRVRRHLSAFRAAPSAEQWRLLVAAAVPEADAAALLVRFEQDEATFATVFAQVIESDMGRLSLSYSRTPAAETSWVERDWP